MWKEVEIVLKNEISQIFFPSFLSALQPWVSLGLLNNQSPFLSTFQLLHPLLYLHYSQVCYHIIRPSQTRSSSSSYKQSSFHHLSCHCSPFHSLYMPQPSYFLSFYKFHNILPVYGAIQFFIIPNSPDIPLLDLPIDLLQYFPFENPYLVLIWNAKFHVHQSIILGFVNVRMDRGRSVLSIYIQDERMPLERSNSAAISD